MNTIANTLAASAVANTKPLWAAVSVLGVAVVALGASLVYVQTRPVDGHTALAAISSPTPTDVASYTAVPVPESLAPQEHLLAALAKPDAAAGKPTPAKTVTKAAPAPALPPAAMAMPAPAPMVASAGNSSTETAPAAIANSGVVVSQPLPAVSPPVCGNCGTVESVTPIQRNAKSGSGIGAVAGGALGAVVGNQIGKGGGRTLATILGAVGGGVAGNAIEKKMKMETVYQVQVRMEDGSLRTVEQAGSATVGARVTIDNGVVHATDQRAWVPAPVRPRPVAQPHLTQAGERA